MNRIAILVPSYNRPDILSFTIRTWLEAVGVDTAIIVADATSNEGVRRYEELFNKLEKRYPHIHLIYDLKKARRGSVNARNLLLKLALETEAQHLFMGDDDLILPNSRFLYKMSRYIDKDQSIGMVSGRVIALKRQHIDPDFYFNISGLRLADALTKVLGYVFLDVINGPRYAEFLPAYYMMSKDVAQKVRFDTLFDTPTAFREESDVQNQVKSLGYRLVLDPQIYFIHLAVEYGGNRSLIRMKERIYWKVRGHTAFIMKYEKSDVKKIWYSLAATLLLATYRPWHIVSIAKGLKEGFKTISKQTP